MRPIIVLFCCLLMLPAPAYALEGISAKAGILMEQSTGKILYEKNAQTPLKMASTTKIMTALCALEYGNASDIVTVSAAAAGVEGSSMYLLDGEELPLTGLIYGLMLNSGNDAAIAIAEHVGGSVEEFSALMNKKAKELGAENTNFVNPNGLDHDDHYTTAKDLAIITRYALDNPEFAKVVSTKSKIIETSGGTKKYLTNHNKLLTMYEGCVGVKTGYTKSSGRSLVSSAKRDGIQMVAVTINAPNDWNDHMAMLDYGFENYKKAAILDKDTHMWLVEVNNGTIPSVLTYIREDYFEIIGKNEINEFDVSYICPQLEAPVAQDSVVGKAVVKKDGEVVFETDLLAMETVMAEEPERPEFWKIFIKFITWG